MHRLLATVVFAYAGLSAAQWGSASRWLYRSDGVLWCGNAVSDPFGFLINVVGPSAALCSALLARRCLQTRRWPAHAIAAWITFVITSACLFCEAHFLGLHGMEIGRVWWIPWR